MLQSFLLPDKDCQEPPTDVATNLPNDSIRFVDSDVAILGPGVCFCFYATSLSNQCHHGETVMRMGRYSFDEILLMWLVVLLFLFFYWFLSVDCGYAGAWT